MLLDSYTYRDPEYCIDNNVITAGDAKQDPLIVAPQGDGLDLNQLWIQCEPDSGTNPHFVFSAELGNVMDVKVADKAPGTQIQIFSRTNSFMQQAVCNLSVNAWKKQRSA